MRLLLLLVVASSALSAQSLSVYNRTDAIRKFIADKGYNRWQPPLNEDFSPVTIYVNLSLTAVAMEEDKGGMRAYFWIKSEWKNPMLKWNPNDYEGTKEINPRYWYFWRPRFRTYKLIEYGKYWIPSSLHITYEGEVSSIGSLNYVTPCQFDYTYWPWDVQTCDVFVATDHKAENGSSVLELGSRDKRQDSLTVDCSMYSSSGWKVMSAVAQKHNETYFGSKVQSDVRVTLKLQRVAWMDRKIALMPVMVVMVLSLLSFWVPPFSSSGRLFIGLASLAILVLAVCAVRTQIPASGAQLPLIVGFAGALSGLVLLQLIVTQAMVYLVSREDSPPSAVVALLEGTAGKALCISDRWIQGKEPTSFSIDVHDLKISPGGNATTDDQSKKGSSSTSASAPSPQARGTTPLMSSWDLVAQGFDRVMFALYLLINVIFMSVYLRGG